MKKKKLRNRKKKLKKKFKKKFKQFFQDFSDFSSWKSSEIIGLFEQIDFDEESSIDVNCELFWHWPWCLANHFSSVDEIGNLRNVDAIPKNFWNMHKILWRGRNMVSNRSWSGRTKLNLSWFLWLRHWCTRPRLGMDHSTHPEDHRSQWDTFHFDELE